MLKKIVSLVVGATLVLATLGVSAAQVATTSTYDVENGQIAVETKVTNANAGEVYTYLAYKLANGGSLDNLQNNEVVYVDEKVIATGETETTFTYTTAIANENAVVVLGNPTTDATIDGGVIEEGKVVRKYTVKVGDGEAVAGELDITDLAETAIVEIPAAIGAVVVTGVKVGGVAVDFIAGNESVKVPLSALTEGAEVVVEVATGAVQAAVTIKSGAYIPAEGAAAEDKTDLSSVLVLAKIEGAATEYGVTFGPGYTDYEVYSAKALGVGSDGLYAIRLYGFEGVTIDGKAITDGTAVWAKAYAVVDGETIYSSNICGIKVGEADAAAEVIDAE